MQQQHWRRLILSGKVNLCVNVFIWLITLQKFVSETKSQDLISILRQNVYYNRDDVPTNHLGKEIYIKFYFVCFLY